MRFDSAFKITLGFEGGYSNEPADKGGKTMYGITEGTLNSAIQKGVVERTSIHNLTIEQAKKIYRTMYWQPVKGDELGEPLDLLVFDCAVNSGVGTAVRLLQRTLNILYGKHLSIDGALGTLTLGALKESLNSDVDMKLICIQYMLYRTKLYSDICDSNPSQNKFLRGWIKQRIVNLCIKAGLL